MHPLTQEGTALDTARGGHRADTRRLTTTRLRGIGARLSKRAARGMEQVVASPVLRRVALDPILSWGWRRYLADGRTPTLAYRAMRTSFLTPATSTRGRLEERARHEQPPLRLPPEPDGLVAGMRRDLLAELRRDGLAVLPSLLPPAMCDEITGHARSATCTLVDPHHGGAASAPFDPSAPRAIRYDLAEEDLLESACMQQLLADESLLALAQDFLGGSPVQDLVAGWWSAPGPGSQSRAAQLFHFDLDRPSFLKLFVYLTDVTTETGPHAFVRGTHRALPRRFRADRRYSDAEVIAHFGGDVVRVSGPRGTLFLADTRALHKGEPVLSGHRLVVQLEWATSLFGAPYARPQLRTPEPSLVEAMRRHPSAYRRFDGCPPARSGADQRPDRYQGASISAR